VANKSVESRKLGYDVFVTIEFHILFSKKHSIRFTLKSCKNTPIVLYSMSSSLSTVSALLKLSFALGLGAASVLAFFLAGFSFDDFSLAFNNS
jgi:hypothetical protein